MRKGEIHIDSIIHMIIKLVFLMIGIAFLTIVATGKGTELNNSVADIFRDMDCKVKLGPVSFDDFLEKGLKAAYTDCKNGDCIKTICATTDFGAVGEYSIVDDTALEDGLDMFNNYLIDIFGGVGQAGANVFCDGDNEDWGDYEIDAVYLDKTYNRGHDLLGAVTYITLDSTESTVLCSTFEGGPDPKTPRGRGFVIPHGAKVKITATQLSEPLSGGDSIDLKVTIEGGEYKTPQTHTPSKPPECTSPDDAPCNSNGKPSWGYCSDTNHCKYYGYCATHSSDTARCQTSAVTCSRGTSDSDRNALSCVNPPTITCSNGYKLQAYNLMNEGGTDVLRAVITGEGDFQTFPIKKGEEIWVKKRIINKLWGTDPDDPEAKISVAVTDIESVSGNYDVKMIIGCY